MILLTKEQRATIQSHQRSYPVKVVALAKAIGIDVFRIEDWDSKISGLIKKKADGDEEDSYEIYVNAGHPDTRRRFTIAHEIAHFMLHKDYIGDGLVDDALYRSGLTNRMEREANMLAAEILMPDTLIDRIVEEKELVPGDENYISELAEALQVSKSALSIKLGVPYE